MMRDAQKMDHGSKNGYPKLTNSQLNYEHSHNHKVQKI